MERTETILDSGVIFDGRGPETNRHIKCDYELTRTVWADGDTDESYFGRVHAECLGCGTMIFVDTVYGETLQELKEHFGLDHSPEKIAADKAGYAQYGFDYDGPTLTGDSQYSKPYCSDKCRKRIARGYQRDRQPKPCQHCGEVLKSNNPKAKYCSAKCRVAYNRSSRVKQ